METLQGFFFVFFFDIIISMKILIVANWKLNPTSQKDALHLFGAIKKSISKNLQVKNIEVVICPPFVYLPLFKGLTLGAQNVFYKEKGAFTGEVSPQMLKDLKVKYVILGHSEVRKYLNETDEIINKKIKAVLDTGLNPILCVGEKEGEDKVVVLQQQITEGLKGILNLKSKILNLVIAYEPVWAIGTGKNCSIDETMSSIIFIRSIIAKLYNRELATKIKILYGGSVKSENSASYIKEAGANGLLVGGASLDPEEFTKIVKSVE